MEPTIEPRTPQQGAHVAQFYDDTAYPAEAIARHLATGLNAGCPALVIATPGHSAEIARALGPSAADVTWLDATETLNSFLGQRGPEPDRFEHSVATLVRSAAATGHLVYAYGEMVDLLSRRGRHDAALQLEDLWNRLAGECSLELLCAYSLSGFNCTADAPAFAGVCDRHTQITPTESLLDLQHESGWWKALARRGGIGERDERIGRCAPEPAADARTVRDELIGIASHELRNPVHVLSLNIRAAATALDAGAPAASVRRRLANAEAQVSRLALLLDRMLRTSGLLAGDVDLEPVDFDMAEAVSTVLDSMQTRLAMSNITTDLQSVMGRWDRGRVEQIIEHLLTHALTFGCGQPIRISLQQFPDFVCLSFSDWGVGDDRDAPIQPAGQHQPRDPSMADFGLWTARQLSEAMGGTVATSRPSGNRFRLILTLPRAVEHSVSLSA